MFFLYTSAYPIWSPWFFRYMYLPYLKPLGFFYIQVPTSFESPFLFFRYMYLPYLKPLVILDICTYLIWSPWFFRYMYLPHLKPLVFFIYKLIPTPFEPPCFFIYKYLPHLKPLVFLYTNTYPIWSPLVFFVYNLHIWNPLGFYIYKYLPHLKPLVCFFRYMYLPHLKPLVFYYVLQLLLRRTLMVI